MNFYKIGVLNVANKILYQMYISKFSSTVRNCTEIWQIWKFWSNFETLNTCTVGASGGMRPRLRIGFFPLQGEPKNQMYLTEIPVKVQNCNVTHLSLKKWPKNQVFWASCKIFAALNSGLAHILVVHLDTVIKTPDSSELVVQCSLYTLLKFCTLFCCLYSRACTAAKNYFILLYDASF
jgi:hypothetical protein